MQTVKKDINLIQQVFITRLSPHSLSINLNTQLGNLLTDRIFHVADLWLHALIELNNRLRQSSFLIQSVLLHLRDTVPNLLLLDLLLPGQEWLLDRCLQVVHPLQYSVVEILRFLVFLIQGHRHFVERLVYVAVELVNFVVVVWDLRLHE